MSVRRLVLVFCAVVLVTVQVASQENAPAWSGQCPSSAGLAECEVKAGIDAYKMARYEEAVSHFRRAVAFNGKYAKAHLYLGVALAQQFIPGAETPDNTSLGEQAIAELSTVLRLDPQDQADQLSALRELASLYFQMKKFNEAKDYYRKLIDKDCGDPTPYYTIAVIDWTESYRDRMKAYADAGIKPEQQQIDSGTCARLSADHLSEVEEGMKMLVKALELRPDYDDAMAYMNLLYRERADLRCNDPQARKADLDQADKWVDATLATKKTKLEKSAKAQEQEPK